jgi:hypothetical protein
MLNYFKYISHAKKNDNAAMARGTPAQALNLPPPLVFVVVAEVVAPVWVPVRVPVWVPVWPVGG